MNRASEEIITLLNESPTNFQAIKYVKDYLIKFGFVELNMRTHFPKLSPGCLCFVTKNDTSLFAFRIGYKNPADVGFKLIATHADSPSYRIKPRPEIQCKGGLIKLNIESYGTPIAHTWFDRPLSIAGRVFLKSDSIFHPECRLVHIKRPLLIIPHLAYHLNKPASDPNQLSIQKDMSPIIEIVHESLGEEDRILSIIAQELGVDKSEIIDFELNLYDATGACLLGVNNEFINSGRMDNLLMVYASINAMTHSAENEMTQVLAIFDNEEVGNTTMSGAASPVLKNVLERIAINSYGCNTEDFNRAIENSFMICADATHAFHPNYSEKYDPTNHVLLRHGPAILTNANKRYTTDAKSSSVFIEICKGGGIPFQHYASHSDISGGSTLGNIFSIQMPIRSVDVGIPLLGMHSIRETASIEDLKLTIKAFTTFFNLKN
jgi:aspartyl aminopeptidase